MKALSSRPDTLTAGPKRYTSLALGIETMAGKELDRVGIGQN